MVKSLPAFHWEEVTWIEWNACPLTSPSREKPSVLSASLVPLLIIRQKYEYFRTLVILGWFQRYLPLRWDESSFSSRFARLLKTSHPKEYGFWYIFKLYLYVHKRCLFNGSCIYRVGQLSSQSPPRTFSSFQEKFHAHMQLLLSNTIPVLCRK